MEDGCKKLNDGGDIYNCALLRYVAMLILNKTYDFEQKSFYHFYALSL